MRSIARKRGTQSKYGQRCFGSNADAPAFVHITHKIKDITWTRQSRKVGDYGWSKSIPKYYRQSFKVGDFLPIGVHSTITAAFRSAIKRQKQYIKDSIKCRDEASVPAEWEADIAVEEKELRLLKSRLTKLKNKNKRNTCL